MSNLLLTILNMSIQGGIIVLVVIALRLLLKKAPKWINLLLWAIVAVRLVCPFSFESRASLMPSGEVISSQITIVDSTPQDILDAPVEDDTVTTPVIDSTINTDTLIGDGTVADAAPTDKPKIKLPIFDIVWFVGIAVLLVYTLVTYLRVRKRVRTAVILKENIYQCETVSSPFVLGIIKPKIYLPFNISHDSAELVIAHEKAHIHRLDHILKPLGFLMLTLHWFNPLVWFGFILFCKDIELACDERVIKGLNSARRADYSEALLNCSINRRAVAACPIAFGEVGVKSRIKSVLSYKKPAFWVVILAVIAIIGTSVCLLTSPMTSGNDTDDAQDATSARLISVLNDETPFINTNGEIVFLSGYRSVMEYGNYTVTSDGVFKPQEYALVDLDGDKVKELVVYGGDQDAAELQDRWYLIFKEEGDSIYGHSLYGTIELKQDGTYRTFHGSYVRRYKTLSFNKTGYTENLFAEYMVYENGDTDRINSSTMNGNEVSYEDIKEFTAEWDTRPDVAWVKYSNNADSKASLADIRQQLSVKNKVCGVLYLGGFAGIDDYKEYCEEFWFDDYPFLSDIKDKQFVEASAGMHYFAIVPTDQKSNVYVDTLFVDGNIHEDTRIRCYTATDNGEPIVIKCNFSDVVEDTLVTVTDSTGTKVEFWPSVFLADGSAMYITETPDLMISLNKTASSLEDVIPNGADIDALSQPQVVNDKVCFKDEKGNIILDSRCFNTVQMIYSDGLPNVLITIADNKEAQFASATAQYLGKTLSLYVDDEVVANPTVVSQITNGQFIISTPTPEEAVAIIDKLKK